ncbi:hypothetical protein Tcan_14609 [Toxocara canis]|uniref:Uncharacterized protein n=1 Tax=Toxocara canis TaxID=6265 RepID=A0A0B2VQ65_TOXCA|nr:hypothetical protein Tcan_14609 [Toxocara canis]
MRRRRDLGNDVVLALPEDHRLGMLNERIPLGGGERVTLAPIVKEYVTVHPNGSLELTKQLNFELQNEIHFSVQIDGPPKEQRKGRLCIVSNRKQYRLMCRRFPEISSAEVVYPMGGTILTWWPPIALARATKGAVVYRVEPEAVPFDVSPFSGDIFSRSGVPNGRYDFDVVATDRLGQIA